eukprot:COSAG06_NODE_238_length_19422_cov_16.417741_15_plen_99_part_00
MNSKRNIAVVKTMLRSGGELRCVPADSDLYGSFLYRSGTLMDLFGSFLCRSGKGAKWRIALPLNVTELVGAPKARALPGGSGAIYACICPVFLRIPAV